MQFSKPTPHVPEALTKHELIQALRLSLASELDAAYTYDAQACAVEDEFIKIALESIRDEEMAHAGEVFSLLRYLDHETCEKFLEGQDEVEDLAEEMGVKFVPYVIAKNRR